jgi:PhoH-like ATPase
MLEKLEVQNKKVYCLDTNIVLDNPSNILKLYDNGNNSIIIPEVVLDEIDNKKSGLEEINYNARQFARLLEDSEIICKENIGDLLLIKTKIVSLDVELFIVSKNKYECETTNIALNILNDRKILEVAKDAQQYFNIITISLDIMFRTRALSLGIPAETLTGKDEVIIFEFHKSLTVDNFNGKLSDIKDEINNLSPETSSLEVTNINGKKFFYFKNRNNNFELIDDKNEKKFPAPPLNLMQKVASNIIYDEADISVVFGAAGCGKNIVALSSAMRLIDTKEYNKIYYIRRTIVSGDTEDELGFLPGTLDDKMAGYNYPLEDSLTKIAKLKKRSAKKEEIDEIVSDYKKKYDIEYLYAGHLRGSTLEDNSILIIDEAQNGSISFMKTVISRVGPNSIVIVLGSNNQIDSKYLNKYNNALTALMKKSTKDNSLSLRVIELKNVIRSKHAEWADIEF